MKNKNAWKRALKVFLWIIGALAVIAVVSILLLKFVFVPKISQKLRDKGMEEIAVLVEENNNVGTIVEVAGVVTDKGVVEFLKNLDSSGKSSAITVLEDMQKEILGDVETKTEKPQTETEKTDDRALSAYERISKQASQKEMSDGLAIIKKLDMSYVSSLLSGGLTQEEKSELKKYVYSRLTRSEISRALELYNKYKKFL